jgi:protein-S-isoprenylcysteine O-methyltransferase Ste14
MNIPPQAITEFLAGFYNLRESSSHHLRYINKFHSSRINGLKGQLCQSVYWAVGIAEIATIVAHELASPSDLSRRIQSNFMLNGGSPKNLRLTPLSVGGVLFIAFGTLIRMWCYRKLKNLFTFEVSIRKDHKLVTTGPYSVVRHPSYSGMLVAYIGLTCWHGSRGSWLRESGVLDTVGGKVFFGTFTAYILGILAALLKRGPVEDCGLRKTFGNQWDEWARRVPYLYVPWIY